MALAITGTNLALAGMVGLGLGVGLVVGVAVMRWVRRDQDK